MTEETSLIQHPIGVPAKPASPLPSPSVTIYSMDIVGLHGKGFIMPNSTTDAVERLTGRYGTRGLAMGFGLSIFIMLALSSCLFIIFCNLITSIAQAIMS